MKRRRRKGPYPRPFRGGGAPAPRPWAAALPGPDRIPPQSYTHQSIDIAALSQC